MLNVVYEDNQVVVVVKPHNQPSQADESKDLDLLSEVKEYVKVKYNKPGDAYIGLVHRLDRPTGGLMVFARTSKAAGRLSKQLSEHETEKKYYCVVEGFVQQKQATLLNYLKKDEKNNIVKVVTQTEEGAKRAELEYKVLDAKGNLSLLEVTLKTGRSHQIRVQLSAKNIPIYGDQKYNKNTKGKQLALWAGKLSFEHPTTKAKMTFVASPDGSKDPWNKFYIDKYFVR